jgi:hypothetical protein
MTKYLPFILLVFTFTLFSSGNSLAQENALLRVVTLNAEDGNPLIGATVILAEPVMMKRRNFSAFRTATGCARSGISQQAWISNSGFHTLASERTPNG